MTLLSLHLTRALERGRAASTLAPTRETLLHTLLRKRAAAHNAGAAELETMLRDQIRWSLPIQSPSEER